MHEILYFSSCTQISEYFCNALKFFSISFVFSYQACREDEFQCKDGSCIPADQRCNRRYDCRDGSDEQECTASQPQCRQGEFKCSTGECINERRKCDKHIDCRDGSDENDCRKLNYNWFFFTLEVVFRYLLL
jgi:Low-density lipoprotein receptor domain class A